MATRLSVTRLIASFIGVGCVFFSLVITPDMHASDDLIHGLVMAGFGTFGFCLLVWAFLANRS